MYEDRATNAGRRIDLRITVIPARGTHRLPDPIFWLAGGPGDAATEDVPRALQLLGAANEQRDLVFVDQRGTGGSNQLRCPSGNAPTRWAAQLRACLAGLGGDTRAYTTAWAVDDLDEVRAALGYDRINLYGGSYGATAAQVYLQRHPTQVRTATLDAGTLLDVPMFERFPASSQRALDLLFARCAADPGCHAAFPDPAGDLRAVTAQLDRGPVRLPLTDPATGRPVTVTRQDLGPALHSLLRDMQTAVMIPRLLHQAGAGDWSRVADLIARSRATDSSQPSSPPSWLMMDLTIMCHESWARLRRADTRAPGGSYLSYDDVRAIIAPEDVCAATPRPQPVALYGALTVVPVPMLLLNGEADPQDPPAGMAGARRNYPNSLLLVAPGQAHQYTGVACRGKIIGTFIDRASTVALPSGCLAEVPVPAFDVD